MTSLRRSRLDPYPASVLETIRHRGLLDGGETVLVALSAGPDSTALVAALAALRDAGLVGPVQALFVDHGLRAGVEAEAEAARATCERLGVPFRAARVVVGTGNVQAAARRARYAALRAEAARVGAARIATGHTRTDQAETVLLRLLRGAGARGLSAIPPKRGLIVRPLIDRAREEGLGLARSGQGLDWRDDPTNASPRFTRNRLRLELWPRLLELNPSLEAALARTADLLRDDERALASRARALVGTASELSVDSLRRAPRAVARRVIRRLARSAGGEGRGPRGGPRGAGARPARRRGRPAGGAARRAGGAAAGGVLAVTRRDHAGAGTPAGPGGAAGQRSPSRDRGDTRWRRSGRTLVVPAAPGCGRRVAARGPHPAGRRPLPPGRRAREQDAQGLAHRPEGGPRPRRDRLLLVTDGGRPGAGHPRAGGGRRGCGGADHPGRARPVNLRCAGRLGLL